MLDNLIQQLIEITWFFDDALHSTTSYSYRHGRIAKITVLKKNNLEEIITNKYADDLLVERTIIIEDKTRTSNYYYNNQGLLESFAVSSKYKEISNSSTFKLSYNAEQRITSMVNADTSQKTNCNMNTMKMAS